MTITLAALGVVILLPASLENFGGAIFLGGIALALSGHGDRLHRRRRFILHAARLTKLHPPLAERLKIIGQALSNRRRIRRSRNGRRARPIGVKLVEQPALWVFGRYLARSAAESKAIKGNTGFHRGHLSRVDPEGCAAIVAELCPENGLSWVWDGWARFK